MKRHADFRLFGAMNPANDIGKRNLPSNIRNRFTEIYVDELNDPQDLHLLVSTYLETLPGVSNTLVKSIVDFYLTLKQDKQFCKQLSNGVGMPPNYSLRTLCRALRQAALNHFNNSLYSVYDAVCLSFLTDLNRESQIFLQEFIQKSILNTTYATKYLAKVPKLSKNQQRFVNIDDYWILKGPVVIDDPNSKEESFIFTKSASENLKKIARVCQSGLPCLIQGDTSIGKLIYKLSLCL